MSECGIDEHAFRENARWSLVDSLFGLRSSTQSVSIADVQLTPFDGQVEGQSGVWRYFATLTAEAALRQIWSRLAGFEESLVVSSPP